jgi:TolB protein
MTLKLAVSQRSVLGLVTLVACCIASLPGFAQQPSDSLGIFEEHGDVGVTPREGSASYDSATGEYRVTGGGANIWAAVDAFQFVWKRFSGDVSITADVSFVGSGAVDHRKAVLMIRQGLEPGAAYADVALHGDGLTALQYRVAPNADTQEVRSEQKAPIRIRIERRKNQFTLYAGQPGSTLTASSPVTLELHDPVYVGIGISSHDENVLETAVFSHVTIENPAPKSQLENPTNVRSKISIYDLATKSTQVIYAEDKLWEAPNWTPDGKYLLANSGGVIYRIPATSGAGNKPEKLALDNAYECNNDHGISPDGKLLAFSATHAPSDSSQVFVASLDGSAPRLITQNAPSYFHGWSRDGKWLAFVGKRNNSFNIYRIAVTGGEEQSLTSHPGYDDGPDFSPDGHWIYINSNRSGGWDIWRFPADGAGPDDSNAERVTSDSLEDWFPHPSPDGKYLAFLSFPNGTPGHDVKTTVQLRMMPMPRGDRAVVAGDDSIQVLAKFFGGQGTINVNSWSPDSKKFAFVSYELLP